MSKQICKHIRIRIPDFLDGKLNTGEEETLRSHLSSCETCRAEAERLRPLMQGLLPATRDRSDDQGADWNRFLVEVNRGIDARVSQRGLKSGFTRPAIITAAAAVLILLAVWMVTTPFGGSQNPDPLFTESLLNEHDAAALESSPPVQPVSSAFSENAAHTSSLATIEEAAEQADEEQLLNATEERLISTLGEAHVVSAGIDYLSDDQIMESVTDSDVNLIAAALVSEHVLSD